MRMRKGVGLAAAAALVVGMAMTVRAGTVVSSGITLVYPDHPLSGPALLSCEPWEEATAKEITLSGIPEGSTVTVNFTWANPYSGAPNYLPPVTYSNVVGGSLVAPVLYPPDSSQWPVWDTATNERAIAVAVLVRVTTPSGTVIKLVSKQWWIRCLPPQRPAEGCTPGYWKQDQHLDSWVGTGYAPTDDYETVFGVDASFDPDTLLDAAWLNGGGERALARHAVAAILNAASASVNYTLSVADIIFGVQNAYATGDFETFKDQLDAFNNAGCPLN